MNLILVIWVLLYPKWATSELKTDSGVTPRSPSFVLFCFRLLSLPLKKIVGQIGEWLLVGGGTS